MVCAIFGLAANNQAEPGNSLESPQQRDLTTQKAGSVRLSESVILQVTL